MATTDDLWTDRPRVARRRELGRGRGGRARRTARRCPSERADRDDRTARTAGTEEAAAEAIFAELVRLRSAQSKGPRSRLLAIDSFDDLLAEAQALEAGAALDLVTIVAIQRASGAIAARADRPMVVLLHRYAVTRRLMWEHSVAALQADRLAPRLLARFGRFLLLWNELTSLAVTEGYRMAEREILARDVEARRGALQELLGVVNDDPASEARLRRVAVAHGLDPDREYLLVAIAPLPNDDQMPERPAVAEEELEVVAGRVGHLLGSAAPGAEGVGAGIRLPAVLPLMGRIAVLAHNEWAGLSRVPTVLDRVLGKTPWVAIGARSIQGVGRLAATYADLVDATRTALRLGQLGWIADPEAAGSRTASSHQSATCSTPPCDAKLGPVLGDERLGDELIETLQAYFDTGENVAAAARRLHLATRTVAYRLEKIESLLGHKLHGPYARRVSIALLVHRLRSRDGTSLVDPGDE